MHRTKATGVPSTNEHTLLWDALLESLSSAVNIAVLIQNVKEEIMERRRHRIYFSGESVSYYHDYHLTGEIQPATDQDVLCCTRYTPVLAVMPMIDRYSSLKLFSS